MMIICSHSLSFAKLALMTRGHPVKLPISLVLHELIEFPHDKLRGPHECRHTNRFPQQRNAMGSLLKTTIFAISTEANGSCLPVGDINLSFIFIVFFYRCWFQIFLCSPLAWGNDPN